MTRLWWLLVDLWPFTTKRAAGARERNAFQLGLDWGSTHPDQPPVWARRERRHLTLV